MARKRDNSVTSEASEETITYQLAVKLASQRNNSVTSEASKETTTYLLTSSEHGKEEG